MDGLVPKFIRFLGPLLLLFHSRNWVHHFYLGKNNKLLLSSFSIHDRHGNIHLVLIMCHVWDKILNWLLPSSIFARKPIGVLQNLKITLTLISLDTVLTTSPGYFSSSYKTTTQSLSLQLLFSASSRTVPKTFY